MEISYLYLLAFYDAPPTGDISLIDLLRRKRLYGIVVREYNLRHSQRPFLGCEIQTRVRKLF